MTDADTGAPLVGVIVSLVDFQRATTTTAEGRGPQHVLVRRIGYGPIRAIRPPAG